MLHAYVDLISADPQTLSGCIDYIEHQARPMLMPVFDYDALDGGERARLTRIEVKPSAVPDVVEAFGDSAVPLLTQAPGFRGALLLADPDSGHLVSQTMWRDPHSRAASPSVAELIEADLFQSARCQIRAVEDYSLVFSSAREA
jgi:hypothetical protein